MKAPPRPTPEQAEQIAMELAEASIVDLVRKLIEAAKDGRAHMSHEDGASCFGCIAVRDALNFVYLMTRNREEEQALSPSNVAGTIDKDGTVTPMRTAERKPSGCMKHPWKAHKYCTRCDVVQKALAEEQLVGFETKEPA